MARIEDALRQIQVSGVAGSLHVEPSDQIDVLFVTSNGAGLGHVTRLLAVAEQLPDGYRYELLTLSRAYEQVRAPGLTVHYFPSSDATQERPHRWNRVFRSYFRQLVEERSPRAVVFDGTWVYSGLTDVCRANDIPLIWVQRGMWKEEKDRTSRQRHDVFKVADEVIVPGDFAGPEDVDAGPGSPHFTWARSCGPPDQICSHVRRHARSSAWTRRAPTPSSTWDGRLSMAMGQAVWMSLTWCASCARGQRPYRWCPRSLRRDLAPRMLSRSRCTR